MRASLDLDDAAAGCATRARDDSTPLQEAALNSCELVRLGAEVTSREDTDIRAARLRGARPTLP
jgi:hypothetical protein